MSSRRQWLFRDAPNRESSYCARPGGSHDSSERLAHSPGRLRMTEFLSNLVKEADGARIYLIMTHLSLRHPLTQSLCLVIALGCSSQIDVAKDNTGGAVGVGGGTAEGGGIPTGGSVNNGTGGSIATGGYYTGTGGSSVVYFTNTGGSSATGGREPTGGGANTGGGNAGGSYTTGGIGCGNFGCLTGGAYTGGSYATGSSWCGDYGCVATGGAPQGGSNATGGAQGTGGGINIYGTGGSTAIWGCTPGVDQTCNDDPTVNSFVGNCLDNGNGYGYCNCISDLVVNQNTGKCNTYGQSVCYSPTQNIDKAYVDRAFGCTCSSVTDPPFCGIDSGGLRVYLECTSNNTWQSGNTNNCNGSDPYVCFSPTQNLTNALTTNGIGCSCNTATSSTHCVQNSTDTDAGIVTQNLSLACTNGRWKAVAVSSCS